jgi:hypothetical protein
LASETQQWTVRARWCRRLAGETADEQLKSSLNDLSAELEERVRGADQQSREAGGDSTQ